MEDTTTPSSGGQPAQDAATATLEPPAPPATPPGTGTTGTPEPKRRGKKGWIIFAVVLALIAIGAVGWYGYQQTTARKLASERFTTATTLVEQADATVIAIDEIVRAEISSDIGRQAAELTSSVEPALTDLEDAVKLIDKAYPDLPEERTDEAIPLRAAADSRIEMLGYAPTILDANVAAASALKYSSEGWDLVLEAEKLADDAVVQYNKLTKDSVGQSKKLTEQATAKFADAKKKFQVAGKAFPEADFGVYIVYIDAKVELLGISQKADDAFLAGKNADANTLSSQYNTKEKDVIAKAGKLPDTPATVVADAYEKVAGEATTSYFDARAKATEADKALSDLKG